MRSFTKSGTMAVKRTAREKWRYVVKNWQLYVVFLLPGLLLTIIFKYLPMGGVLIAFEDYNVIKGVFGSPWVGLEYFRRFLSSPDFMSYLLNTLKLSVYGLLWGFPVPILLALLLNQIRRTGIRKKIQLLIYAPNFISVIVLCGMVRMFLSPVGPLNSLLGISTNWMTMPEAFRTIYIASGIWQTAGWSSIMYTAALANASKDLEEAAAMEGCRDWQALVYILMPLLKPILATGILLTAKYAWNDFLFPLVFTESSALKTIPYGLSSMQSTQDTNWTVLLAALTISALPMVLLFILLQKQFVRGLAAGGVKG